MGIQASHELFGVGNVTKIEKSEHKGIENREHMRNLSFADLASILSERDVATVMQAVFNGPVFAVQFEQTSRISLFGRETGDAIDKLLRTFEGMFHTSA